MIIYISTEKNKNILKKIEKDYNLVIKQYIGEYDFKNTITSITRRLSDFNNLKFIIDIRAVVKDLGDELCENDFLEISSSIEHFINIYNSEFSFYFDDINDVNIKFIKDLISIHQYNIIIYENVSKLNKDLIECINGKKSRIELLKRFNIPAEEFINIKEFELKPKIYIFNIYGNQPRVGTTYFSIMLNNFFLSAHKNSYYLEINNNNHIKTLRDSLHLENAYYFSGDEIGVKNISEDNSEALIFILDKGVLNNNSLNINIDTSTINSMQDEVYIDIIVTGSSAIDDEINPKFYNLIDKLNIIQINNLAPKNYLKNDYVFFYQEDIKAENNVKLFEKIVDEKMC